MANVVNYKCYHMVSAFNTFYVCRNVKYHPNPVAVWITGIVLLYIHTYLFYTVREMLSLLPDYSKNILYYW